MTTFTDAAERIGKASTFAELGDLPYREWVKLVHPDVAGVAGTAVFAKLSLLYAERGGTVLRTKKNVYRVGPKLFAGDIADLSEVDGGAALLKVPRSPGDNDLMECEAAALQKLRTDGDPKYRPYAPRLVESFVHEDGDRKRRRVNVVERLDGFVPVSLIRREIDPRDAAWMWRRLLVALGWAHRAGVVHGAVVEEHVLIHPGEHGVALIDWCYSGERATAVVKTRAAAYPPEVLREHRNTPATDIYMATGLMTRLVGGGLPKAMRRFADGCLYEAPRMRPQDAWALLGEFDELLHGLYGPRTFRPFTV